MATGLPGAAARNPTLPIVMLTALAMWTDRITGSTSCRDYVRPKRQPQGTEATPLAAFAAPRSGQRQVVGDPQLPEVIQVQRPAHRHNKRQVYRNDERISASPAWNSSLLELLRSAARQPFSRGEILKEVWGYTPERS